MRSETGREIKPSDWQVDIGNTSYHANFSAIIVLLEGNYLLLDRDGWRDLANVRECLEHTGKADLMLVMDKDGSYYREN